jgi:hypothetical protein
VNRPDRSRTPIQIHHVAGSDFPGGLSVQNASPAHDSFFHAQRRLAKKPQSGKRASPPPNIDNDTRKGTRDDMSDLREILATD